MLNLKTFSGGAAIQSEATFTRPTEGSGSGIDYTGSSITLELYVSPTQTTPSLTLSVGSGLTKTVDTPQVQSVALVITSNQIATLLGTASSKEVSFAWSITPTGGYATRKPEGGGYTGTFKIIPESRAGRKS